MRPIPRLLVTAIALATGACANPQSGDGGDSLPSGDRMLLDDFFSLAGIHAIAIEVDSAGYAALIERPRDYTRAAVTIDGESYPDVGVRLKGGAGSFVALDGDYPPISGDGNGNPGKSAFIIDFNRFASGGEHLGLKKLTLNNMVQDPSCIHEYLGYALFRAGGVPASRAGFARVTFNDQVKGLYAAIETPDNDCFLERWFGHDDGNLYEGEYGADLRVEAIERLDQDNGADETRDDLRGLIAALDSIPGVDDAYAFLSQRIKMDGYLTFAATELYLGHWDGYAQSANNYALYHDTVTGNWTFVPWGIDQTFVDRMEPFNGVMLAPGPAWPHGGRIHQLCFASPACRADLHAAFAAVLDRADALDLIGLAAETRDLVEGPALEESTAHGDPERALDALGGVADFIAGRRAEIETWLPCLAGETVDRDGDTFDGCTVDCNDHAAAMHPGAVEACNFVDDDCNGVLDDPVECPKCLDETGPDAGTYGFCFTPRTWVEARQQCQSQGRDLASIHDDATWELVSFRLLELAGIPDIWIGLNDRETEASHTWTDDSELDYEHWAEDGPFDAEENDCVLNLPHGWWVTGCDEAHAFVCRAF